MVQPDILGGPAEDGADGGDRRHGVLSHGQASAGVEVVGLVVAEHLDADRLVIPGWGVYAWGGHWGECPDEVVVDEEVWAGAPVLLVAVVVDESLHACVGKAVGQVAEFGYCCVV